jgi:hypothetical protein
LEVKYSESWFGRDIHLVPDPLKVEGFAQCGPCRSEAAGGQDFGAGPGPDQPPVFVVPEDTAIVAFGQPVTGAVFLYAIYIGKGGFVDLAGKYGDIDDLEEVIGGRWIIDTISGGEPKDVLPVYKRRGVKGHGSTIERYRVSEKILFINEDDTGTGAGEDHPGLPIEAPFRAAVDDGTDRGGRKGLPAIIGKVNQVDAIPPGGNPAAMITIELEIADDEVEVLGSRL